MHFTRENKKDRASFRDMISVLFEKLASGGAGENSETQLSAHLPLPPRPEMQWSQPGEKKLTGGQNWQNKTMSTTQWSPAPVAPQPMPVPHVVRKHMHAQAGRADSQWPMWHCEIYNENVHWNRSIRVSVSPEKILENVLFFTLWVKIPVGSFNSVFAKLIPEILECSNFVNNNKKIHLKVVTNENENIYPSKTCRHLLLKTIPASGIVAVHSLNAPPVSVHVLCPVCRWTCVCVCVLTWFSI